MIGPGWGNLPVGGSVHRNSNKPSKVDKNMIERLLCNVYAVSMVSHDKIPVFGRFVAERRLRLGIR